jgi:hypothetical protein
VSVSRVGHVLEAQCCSLTQVRRLNSTIGSPRHGERPAARSSRLSHAPLPSFQVIAPQARHNTRTHPPIQPTCPPSLSRRVRHWSLDSPGLSEHPRLGRRKVTYKPPSGRLCACWEQPPSRVSFFFFSTDTPSLLSLAAADVLTPVRMVQSWFRTCLDFTSHFEHWQCIQTQATGVPLPSFTRRR